MRPNDFEYGSEIGGVVCPEGGCTLVWVEGRAYCDEHEYVEPVNEELSPPVELDDDAKKWLRANPSIGTYSVD